MLFHPSAWEVARGMPNRMQPRTQYHSPGQPWPVANKKPFFQTGFHSKGMVKQGGLTTSDTISEETVVASRTHRHSTGFPGNKVKMNLGNLSYFAMSFCGAYFKWQWEHVILSRCMCHFCVLFVLVIRGRMTNKSFYWLSWAGERAHFHLLVCWWSVWCLPAHPTPPCPVPASGIATGNSMGKQESEVIWLHDNLPCPQTDDRSGSWCWRSTRRKAPLRKNAKHSDFWDPLGWWLPKK